MKADDVAREGDQAVMKGRSVVVNGAIYQFMVAGCRAQHGAVAIGCCGPRYRKT